MDCHRQLRIEEKKPKVNTQSGSINHFQSKTIYLIISTFYTSYCIFLFLGCAPFGESKNGFLILDLPDFVAERNAKLDL